VRGLIRDAHGRFARKGTPNHPIDLTRRR
jgi:hypothetical protein